MKRNRKRLLKTQKFLQLLELEKRHRLLLLKELEQTLLQQEHRLTELSPQNSETSPEPFSIPQDQIRLPLLVNPQMENLLQDLQRYQYPSKD